MKQLLLATALFLVATTGYAQKRKASLPPPTLNVPIEFCILIVRNPGIAQELVLDFGQGPPTNVTDSTMVRLFIKTRGMVSAAAALNYLYSQGWEPQQASAFSYRENSTNQVISKLITTENEVFSQQHYLLRRRPRP